MSKYQRFIPLLFWIAALCLPTNSAAQGQINLQVESSAPVGTGRFSPFWLITNQYGLLSTNKNQAYLRAEGSYSYAINQHAQLKAGMDIVGAVHSDRAAYLRQAYIETSYRSLTLTLGAKNWYSGLLNTALSSGDMVHSTNAAPIPEINLSIRDFQPIPFTNGWLKLKGDIAIGRSFDSRYLRSHLNTPTDYVEKMLWHHKSLYLRVGKRNALPVTLTLGLQHWAQWGGSCTNPAVGKQPSSLKDFWKVFCGSEGGNGSTWADAVNVLGNHYGSYDLMLTYDSHPVQLTAYHQHYFEDKGGMEWSNGLDGLWGGTLTLPRWRYVHTLLFEYVTTRNQSGPLHFIDYDHTAHPGRGGGCDNYYNNGEYATGVSYYQHTLGNPLLINPAYSQQLGFKHNRIRAYHVAATGQIKPGLSYKIHFSHTTSWGRMEYPISQPEQLTAIGLQCTYDLRKHPAWQVEASTGCDWGTLLGDSWGMQLLVRWSMH